ncbi:MAG: hypothetical protein QOG01_1331 [Pseudonocardiales bacterium]|jgi:hypothetical protein|nr:hypothetical protein [Pseudonocardiales bacterium]
MINSEKWPPGQPLLRLDQGGSAGADTRAAALIKVAALVRTPALNDGYEYGTDLRGALDVERGNSVSA